MSKTSEEVKTLFLNPKEMGRQLTNDLTNISESLKGVLEKYNLTTSDMVIVKSLHRYDFNFDSNAIESQFR